MSSAHSVRDSTGLARQSMVPWLRHTRRNSGVINVPMITTGRSRTCAW